MNYDYCTLATTIEEYDEKTGAPIPGTQKNTVVAYLAPLDRINVVLKNNLFIGDREAAAGSIVKNRSIVRHELTLQGEFIDAAEMAGDHQQAVRRLFGRGDVTAERQFLWLQNLALYVGGHYSLKLGNDYYSALRDRDLVYATAGTRSPQVVFGELRRTQDVNPNRIGYTIRFVAGFEKSTGEMKQE